MAKKMMDADSEKDPYQEKDEGDIAEQGYRKIAFGPDEKINYRIEGAYAKQANPQESENTKLHDIAKHQVQSQFYSDKKKKE